MKEFWDGRYAEEEYAYGVEPNDYFKEKLGELTPGKILFVAEGEGRNAVYAAMKGWDVFAFDISAEGKRKADLLASKNQVKIEYGVGTLEEMNYQPESFDAIVLIFSHFPPKVREEYHQKLPTLLKKGGVIISEMFSVENLEYAAKNPSVGGPKSKDFLTTISQVQDDFKGFEMVELQQKERSLSEGKYHKGLSSVIQFFY